MASGGVPWGLFAVPFVLLPVAVIGGSKILEMVGVMKPPSEPEE